VNDRSRVENAVEPERDRAVRAAMTPSSRPEKAWPDGGLAVPLAKGIELG
jgi:hypothetical protein